jgi:glycosyltransferase involved in cell wall biosynthesis
MRILMVNWAPLREGARFGGGANGYAHDLALALQARGHTIGSLTSGLIHVPDNQGKQGVIEARRMPDYHGIETFDIINSPVLAWSLHQFRHPIPETWSPALEAEFLRFLRAWKPDVVHFHNIEGFTSMCPAIARTPSEGWEGARVVYSLHNYHTICPQVFLMHNGTTPCTHFDNGHRCVDCFDAPHTHIVLEDRLRDSARLAKREDVFAPGRPKSFADRLMWKEPPTIALPGDAIGTDNTKTPMPHAPHALQPRGTTTQPLASRTLPLHVIGQPLTNEISPEPGSAREPNDYARRRDAMLRMLGECDAAHAVSSFVARKFESMGVPSKKIQTLTIGTRLTSIVAEAKVTPAPLPLSHDGSRPSRPIRLAFLGYHNFYKGLHVLCAALEMLPLEIRELLDLAVHAKDVAPMVPTLRRLSLSMARVVVEEGYKHEELPILLRQVDLGIVPSVWWDNGPQTVMEFLACGVPVLASNVGGIPDFIRHEHNGLLVPGNDPKALANQLASLVQEPTRLTRLRQSVTPPKSIGEHAHEIESLYERTRRADG